MHQESETENVEGGGVSELGGVPSQMVRSISGDGTSVSDQKVDGVPMHLAALKSSEGRNATLGTAIRRQDSTGSDSATGGVGSDSGLESRGAWRGGGASGMETWLSQPKDEPEVGSTQ